MRLDQMMKNLKNSSITLKLIIALVVAGVVWMMWPASQDKTIKPAALQVLELADKIRIGYIKKPDFWGLNTETLIKNKLAPENMINKDKLINSLGVEVLVGNGPTGEVIMPGDRSFDVVYTGLNKEQCAELASYEFIEANAIGIISLTIINEGEEKIFEWGANDGKTIEFEDALRICKKQNRLLWTFGG